MTTPETQKLADDYEKRIREKVHSSGILTAGEWVYLVGLFQMERDALREPEPAPSTSLPDAVREALEVSKAAMLRTRTASIAGCEEGYGSPTLWADELFASHGDLTKAIKLCEAALSPAPEVAGLETLSSEAIPTSRAKSPRAPLAAQEAGEAKPVADGDIAQRLRGKANDMLKWNGETMQLWDKIRRQVETFKGSDMPRLMFEDFIEEVAELLQSGADALDAAPVSADAGLTELRKLYEAAAHIEHEAQNGRDYDEVEHADAIAQWQLAAWKLMPALLSQRPAAEASLRKAYDQMNDAFISACDGIDKMRVQTIERCARVADEAKAAAHKHHGVEASIGADIAARRIRALLSQRPALQTS